MILRSLSLLKAGHKGPPLLLSYKPLAETSLAYVDTKCILMAMTTKIAKWGNSYAVRLPKAAMDKLSLREGSSVIVSTESSNIRIKPTRSVETLGELISRIHRNNLPELVVWKGAVGNELW